MLLDACGAIRDYVHAADRVPMRLGRRLGHIGLRGASELLETRLAAEVIGLTSVFMGSRGGAGIDCHPTNRIQGLVV
jgi:hypothetical protein